ncbi:MAG: glycosyltransferase [Bacteroidales bacterium]|nr:glycosyltransferase [Candidatus Cryptobacteroides aphodequi]
MMLSRMDEKSKRISAALRIWKRVQPSHPDWKLVIVGGGDDLPWFKKLARGLQGVSFEGRQPDSLPYYRGASIFMLTSRYEGWGITLTEAQQCGAVPVAFASYASASDIIESGANGLLVKDRDEKAFAQALETLMDDDKLRSSMALRGLDSVQAFRGKAVVSRWMELLEKTSAAK